MQFTIKNAQFLLTTAWLLTQNSQTPKISVLNFQAQWQMETYCDDSCCKEASTFFYSIYANITLLKLLKSQQKSVRWRHVTFQMWLRGMSIGKAAAIKLLEILW